MSAQFTFIFLLLLFNFVFSSVVVQDLGSDSIKWGFSSQNETVTGQAKVPGGIFVDLKNAGILKESFFFRYNDIDYRWVSKDNWTFHTSFKVSDELLQKEQINLILDGVNTVANISLNGKQLCGCKNMFTRFVFPISRLIKKDGSENDLVVKFKSSIAYGIEQDKINPTMPRLLPSEFKGESHANMVRTMQASFGWDWGPALPSQGLWKKVFLEGYDTVSIRDITYQIDLLVEQQKWKVTIFVFVEQPLEATADLLFNVELTANKGEIISMKKNVHLNAPKSSKDDTKLESTIFVPNDKVDLWWPNGMNQSQPLYKISVSLTKDGKICSERTNKIGFRTLKLIQKEVMPEEPEKGRFFYFEVNGKAIFAKGSNYIPAHVLPEMSTDPKVTEHLLRSSAEAGHNMLRVWGGGTYETDYFYQLCDELGIMIWQDFMFANGNYPGDEAFNKEVENEVTVTVRRLQYHPSVALWAGNNENEGATAQGWWGNTEEIRANYIKLYGHIIRDIVIKEDPLRPYVPSSPTNGLKTEQDGFLPNITSAWSTLYGDTHVYAYGAADLMESKAYTVARFVSEFGFQSLPFLRVWQKDTYEEDLMGGMESEFAKFRQHQSGGNQRVFSQTARLFIPQDREIEFKSSAAKLGDLIYLTQITQAIGTKVEAEKHRRFRNIFNESTGEGHTMGSMYWQLNDIWAAPSWGGIDCEGTWKITHYFMAKVYAPVTISVDMDRDPVKNKIIQVYAINDLLTDLYNLELEVKIYSWQHIDPLNVKKIKIEKLTNLSAEPVLVGAIYEYLQTNLNAEVVMGEIFLTFQLLDKNGNPLSGLEFMPMLHRFKEMNFESPPKLQILSVEKSSSPEKYPSRYQALFDVKIATDKPAPFLWLDAGEIRGRFSENGFMFAQSENTVQFLALQDLTADELRESLTIQSLYEAMKVL